MDETISCRGRCGLTWFPAGPPSDCWAVDVDWYQPIDKVLGSGCESEVCGNVCPLSDRTSNGASLISDFDNTAIEESSMRATSATDAQAAM